MRAQTSLPVLGVALVLVVVATLFAASVANGQLASAAGTAVERQTAAGIAERLVAADSPVTARANVVRDGQLSALSVGDLRSGYGLGAEDAVRVGLGDSEVTATDGTDGGSTVERIVLVETLVERTVQPRFDGTRSVTLPRRTANASVTISPSGNGTVETIRSNGAVVLHDTDGLSGTFDVDVSRFETATLAFQGSGALSRGDVDVDYWPAQTRKATLRVTVNRWSDPDG